MYATEEHAILNVLRTETAAMSVGQFPAAIAKTFAIVKKNLATTTKKRQIQNLEARKLKPTTTLIMTLQLIHRLLLPNPQELGGEQQTEDVAGDAGVRDIHQVVDSLRQCQKPRQ
eukprot:COSAG05_NODE_75_length_21588_cov_303.091438_5_plen_115_part_00